MRTIIVDDEKIMLRQLEMELTQNPKVALEGAFTLSTQALEYAEKNTVECALLDIEMPTMSGIELGKRLRQLQPDMVIIYVTGYSEYISEAIFDVKSDYYLLKPYSSEDIRDIVDRASLLSLRQRKRVYIHTFGRFEVYIDGIAMSLSNAKAKELLALCVDHMGGEVTMEECVDKLWGDRPYDARVKNLYRKAVFHLNKALLKAGVNEIFESKRGRCSVDMKKLDCDYMKLFSAAPGVDTRQYFTGEYMIQYGWARETEAKLGRIYPQEDKK